jgi:hypothetical protein
VRPNDKQQAKAPQLLPLRLFDHFVGALQDRLRHREAERLGNFATETSLVVLVRGERCDQSLLIEPDKVRKGTTLNVRNYGLVGLIDCIRAKTSDNSCHDSFVFRGSSTIAEVASHLGVMPAN